MTPEPGDLRRSFVLVDGRTTVGEVRDRTDIEDSRAYVVVALAAGRFSVFRLDELIGVLRESNPVFRPELLLLALEDVPNLLGPRPADALEEARLTAGRVRALRKGTPCGRWVVLKDGRVTGVLAFEVAGASQEADLRWLSPAEAEEVILPGGPAAGAAAAPAEEEQTEVTVVLAAAGDKVKTIKAVREATGLGLQEAKRLVDNAPGTLKEGVSKEEAAAIKRRFKEAGAHVVLSTATLDLAVESLPAPPAPKRSRSVLSAAEPPQPSHADEKPEPRWINAQLEGREASEPLRVGETYTIAFDVDVESRPNSLVADAKFQGSFASGEESVELTVQLSSEDFEVLTEPQKLRVPRRGKSRNKARFDVSARHAGTGVLQAVFLKDGNFVQLVTVRLDVGESAGRPVSPPRVLGRNLDASFAMEPRDVTLVLTNTGHGFQAILAGAVSAIATLPITLPQLDGMISEARKQLQEVVDLESGPDKSAVYQAGIDIPPEVNDAALRAVAKAGFRLFQQIFDGPAADAQSRLLGARLREMALRERLKIQILSEQFLLPWGILYMADSFDPDHIDPEMFLGFKHVIEHIPLQPAMQVLASTIDGRPLLSVSLNVNTDIDEQMGIPVIADQLEYWDKISRRGATKLIVRKTGQEVMRALADTSSPDQLLYFYCHAVSKSLSEGGGPDASALVLSGDGRLTLGDLSISAPIGKSLSGAPLVFINACESAELSPLFYDGFVPYFMGKGARGVIGTECQTPAIFAAEWARRFFDEFLQGKALGQVFLDLRREFYERHNNLLGLLYALYCDGDTQIVTAAKEGEGRVPNGPTPENGNSGSGGKLSALRKR